MLLSDRTNEKVVGIGWHDEHDEPTSNELHVKQRAYGLRQYS